MIPGDAKGPYKLEDELVLLSRVIRTLSDHIEVQIANAAYAAGYEAGYEDQRQIIREAENK